ncbi:hypothetical protein CTH30272_03059 [Allocatenococcus thiocycli]|nr:hypothetical protein CTH30272_03059 [Catenococcus thiocycli]
MQCKCGGEVVNSVHSVKTEKGLAGWHDSAFVKSKAPYSIDQSICKACGRVAHIIVTDSSGDELLPRWPDA